MFYDSFEKYTKKKKKYRKSLHTVKPLIERHPVFLKITVRDICLCNYPGFPGGYYRFFRDPFYLVFFFLFHANADAERGISG